jgi:hypothetical protein
MAVDAEGSMAQIAILLWKVEAARVPVRIRDFQLASLHEGIDALHLKLQLETIAPLQAGNERGNSATTIPSLPATRDTLKNLRE